MSFFFFFVTEEKREAEGKWPAKVLKTSASISGKNFIDGDGTIFKVCLDWEFRRRDEGRIYFSFSNYRLYNMFL